MKQRFVFLALIFLAVAAPSEGCLMARRLTRLLTFRVDMVFGRTRIESYFFQEDRLRLWRWLKSFPFRIKSHEEDNFTRERGLMGDVELAYYEYFGGFGYDREYLIRASRNPAVKKQYHMNSVLEPQQARTLTEWMLRGA